MVYALDFWSLGLLVLFTRTFHLDAWFTLVFFVILVLPLMLSSHDKKISQIKRSLTQQITDRHKKKAQAQMISNSSDVEHTWPRVSFPGPPRAIACFGTARDTLTALRNRRYLPYFLLFMSFYEFWSSKKIIIRQTGPSYFNSLSLIFGFEVSVGIS